MVGGNKKSNIIEIHIMSLTERYVISVKCLILSRIKVVPR